MIQLWAVLYWNIWSAFIGGNLILSSEGLFDCCVNRLPRKNFLYVEPGVLPVASLTNYGFKYRKDGWLLYDSWSFSYMFENSFEIISRLYMVFLFQLLLCSFKFIFPNSREDKAFWFWMDPKFFFNVRYLLIYLSKC